MCVIDLVHAQFIIILYVLVHAQFILLTYYLGPNVFGFGTMGCIEAQRAYR